MCVAIGMFPAAAEQWKLGGCLASREVILYIHTLINIYLCVLYIHMCVSVYSYVVKLAQAALWKL